MRKINRLLCTVLFLFVVASDRPTAVADEATKPVQVFILAGQSNMEGQGVVDLDHPQHYNGGKGILNTVMKGERAPQYSHIKDGEGNWVVRDDVFVRFQTTTTLKRSGLSIGFAGYDGKHHIGPEFQFGHVVGNQLDEPVLLIKTAWGGKSLFRDFRPPSSVGETGPFYKQMIAEVEAGLAGMGEDFPQLAGRKQNLAGFVWFQGWNDMYDETARTEYEQNLVNLIKDVRSHFKSPNLPAVIGELGNGGPKAGANMIAIREAQRAAAEREEFNGSVCFVSTTGFARLKEDSPNVGHGHHWFGNAESYFLIGDALGRAMLEQLGRGHKVIRDVAYKTGDTDYEKTRCRLDLYVPENAKNAPCLVWFHGGGLTAGSKNASAAVDTGRRMAEAGMIVAVVNYRLSPEAKFPAYIEDSAASVAWMISEAKKYSGDPKSVFVGGHSAGAYLTMMVGLDEQYLGKHGLKLTDLAGTIPVSAQVDSHWTVRAERGIDRDEQVIDQSAPLFHVRGDAAPMIIFVADNDLEGRADMNRRFFAAMQKAEHKAITFHEIAERNHGTIMNRILWPGDEVARRMSDFIRNHRTKEFSPM